VSEQLLKHTFPQCAPANLETSCLLDIGDISWKLRLRCGCQFPWCALSRREEVMGNFIIRSCSYNVMDVTGLGRCGELWKEKRLVETKLFRLTVLIFS
jgi:hypothetical protein